MTFVGVEINPSITIEEIYGGFMIFSFFSLVELLPMLFHYWHLDIGKRRT